MGIPGITAHRAVFADGPVDGATVLVHGALGAVGSVAAQLAAWDGATVIITVRRTADLALLPGRLGMRAVALDVTDPVAAIREHAPDGVDRVVEVAFSDNVELDAAVARNGAVIAAYGTRTDRPDFPFWPMLFDNLTIRLLGSDDFPADAKQQAARDLTEAARTGGRQAVRGELTEDYPLRRAGYRLRRPTHLPGHPDSLHQRHAHRRSPQPPQPPRTGGRSPSPASRRPSAS